MITTERLERFKYYLNDLINPSDDRFVDGYNKGLQFVIEEIGYLINESERPMLKETIGEEAIRSLPNYCRPKETKVNRTDADNVAQCMWRLHLLKLLTDVEYKTLEKARDLFLLQEGGDLTAQSVEQPSVEAQGLGDIFKMLDREYIDKIVELLNILDVRKIKMLLNLIDVDETTGRISIGIPRI
jgi:hypothetical protein